MKKHKYHKIARQRYIDSVSNSWPGLADLAADLSADVVQDTIKNGSLFVDWMDRDKQPMVVFSDQDDFASCQAPLLDLLQINIDCLDLGADYPTKKEDMDCRSYRFAVHMIAAIKEFAREEKKRKKAP